jgi:DHA2 family multidrug resistance protein
MERLDARIILAIGFALLAARNFANVYLSGDYAADQLFRPNIERAVGQALVFTPLGVVAVADIEASNAGSASALFNMMRNLGGAIGIAALQTFETKREQFHSNVLTQAVSLFEPATRARIAALMRYFLDHGVADQALAAHKAIVAIGLRVRQQASIMAFGDTFYLLGIALFIALIASLFFRKSRPSDAGRLSAGH